MLQIPFHFKLGVILFRIFLLTNRMLCLGLLIIMTMEHLIHAHTHTDRSFHTLKNPKRRRVRKVCCCEPPNLANRPTEFGKIFHWKLCP